MNPLLQNGNANIFPYVGARHKHRRARTKKYSRCKALPNGPPRKPRLPYGLPGFLGGLGVKGAWVAARQNHKRSL